ncbi:conserved exported hypothetical protein [Carnobacterium maltaromaticum]|uniref:WxL domain-containing protein n=1 Tax=Carnobacterium maltaromaticum TaxID=2751 RepID=A0AAW9K4W0_CARML|nr:WxL domain-containing protein [Carnobacterium maltaromaticum]MDZ5759224.1 WxL domain-containing protein [Carnobacterium maltaromaticum]CAD5898792.1 conserved exported hypothetical protein [Carnobacterium maltaromaticum]
MKLSNYCLIGMGILISTTLFGGQTAQAVDPETSEALFELQESDPLNPTVPGIIDEGIKPPTNQLGPLSIDAVTSFQFGTRKLGQEGGDLITASPIAPATKLGVQVTDDRGQDLGWNLKVKASKFMSVGTETAFELEGAAITIPEGTLRGKEGISLALKPTAFAVTLNETEQSIMKASTTQGRSSWLNYFNGGADGTGTNPVTLSVPAGNKKANYKSTLTWTLEDAPGA